MSAPVSLGAAQTVRDGAIVASKLRRAASEFEGLLIAQLWNSMQEGLDRDSQHNDPAMGSFRSLGIEAAANALAARGGLGLGEMMYRALLPKGATP